MSSVTSVKTYQGKNHDLFFSWIKGLEDRNMNQFVLVPYGLTTRWGTKKIKTWGYIVGLFQKCG